MLKVWINIFLLFCILTSCNSGNKNESKTLLFVGDLLLDRGVKKRINHLGVESLFHSSIDSIFKTSNYVFANLECPATDIVQPINKKFIFRANPEWLIALKKHGITHLCMANNHSMDQGRLGLIDTKENILKNKLIPLGYGKDAKTACQVQLISEFPRKIYLISSSLTPSENWTYLEDSPCICEESIEQLSERIKLVKLNNPTCVLFVQLHWGAEHTLIPLTAQKQDAYQLIDAGADGIIGHHSHTVQSIEIYKEKPIYYSIGNFIFDQSKPINTKGIMVRIEIEKSSVKFDTIGFKIKNCVPQIN
jgi:poly-gamma-glutamate capsule biosynthesis protein CapA/YwtB (metallophosphatase superfamily)